MDKFLEILWRVTISIIILIVIECVITMGYVLNFKEYSTFGWIFQSLLLLATIITGYKWYKNDYKK